MLLSEFKNVLTQTDSVSVELEDGTAIPVHFHITEVGKISKQFIDCGGTVRTENKISLQIWFANDLEHRLSPHKLLDILKISEEKLNISDSEVVCEYQGVRSIEKYNLEYNGKSFVLKPTQTECLAEDHCGIPAARLVVKQVKNSCCAPESGCC
ncbi:MAG: DUF6428 family protein [Cytophagales bacterium]